MRRGIGGRDCGLFKDVSFRLLERREMDGLTNGKADAFVGTGDCGDTSVGHYCGKLFNSGRKRTAGGRRHELNRDGQHSTL